MSNAQEKKPITFKELYAMQSEALYDLIMANDQQWRKEWADDGFQQQNATTEKAYNNLNQTLLFKRVVSENMDDPRWITFNQAKEKGYKVKKGVKGSQIFRLVTGYERIKRDENDQPIKNADGKAEMEYFQYDRPRIKMFTVFNARDVENIPPFIKAEIPEEHKRLLQQENYKNAEIMVREYCEKNGISLQEMASERAFHQYNNGSGDKKVVVPLKAQFDDLNSYFATLFHEVGHSTKHLGIRINQETDTPMGNEFGSRNYAKEELTAELTSLLLCKQFGIDSTDNALQDNSFSYLQSWILNGFLTKEDFEVATIEANRASKAIFEHAPEMKLTLDDIKQGQNDKIAKEAVEWVLSEKAFTPDYITMNAITNSDNLNWEYIREQAFTHHLHKNDFELAEKVFNTQEHYYNLREEANNLKNGSKMTIDLAEMLLERNTPLSNQEKAVMQASIGFDDYRNLEFRADVYLKQWEEIKDIMQNKGISEESNILRVARIINNTENKVELKAVVAQILENEEKANKISQEQHNALYAKYAGLIEIESKVGTYEERFNEVEKIRNDLFNLWQSWDNRENYDQFLQLTEFERQPNIDPLTQEKDYFTALIDEFNKKGQWQKLTDNVKEAKSIKQDPPPDLFKLAVNKIYEQGSLDIAFLQSTIKKGSTKNVPFAFKKDEIISGIEHGYLIDKGKIAFSPVYEITEKGKEMIDTAQQQALAKENEKHGKKVTKKEVSEMIDSIYSVHRFYYSGSREYEFRDSPFPEKIFPKLEKAREMLERPFNEHSLPHKDGLKGAIENSELVLKQWDNIQQSKLETTQGEEIVNVKLLWSTQLADVQDVSFNTNLDKLQKWFTDTYGDTENKFNPLNINYQGYAKNNFMIDYKEQGSNEITNFELRIDVGKSPNDFNPLTSHIKNYLESVLNREFIEQHPKLSAEIKQELDEAKKVQHTEQQGIKM